MDFFAQQDLARRNARLLLLLFLLAVFGLIVLTNAAVSLFVWYSDQRLQRGTASGLEQFFTYFSWQQFAWISLFVGLTVGLVVMVRWIALSTGGKVVAESMGGQRILPQTDDRAQRRLLNIVEEMALAAGMPVPAVYEMPRERGINAFAAGVSPTDAVVAVTRGALLQLKRDELQGVVAHEFSHILNGDMRLNIRLAALLSGITFVGDVGHILLRGSGGRRSGIRTGGNTEHKGGGQLALLGLGLMAIGWLGGVAAGLIKAAISRQKEFLADASAVQFTRSTDGIADALKAIGGYVPGSLVQAARAAEMSHIFFGQIEHSLWQLFATHPPLDERIRRLDPQWEGAYPQRDPVPDARDVAPEVAAEVGVGRAAIVAAAAAAASAQGLDDNVAQQPAPADSASSAGQPLKGPVWTESAPGDADFSEVAPLHSSAAQTGFDRLAREAHEPLGAQAILFALLLGAQDEVRAAQGQAIEAMSVEGLQELTLRLQPMAELLSARERLPLVELCLPALKAMSEPQYRRFKNTLLRVIQADARTELFEWCLFQLVRHYLDPEFLRIKPSRPRYRQLRKVAYHLRVVLSVLAHNGSAAAAAPESERASVVAGVFRIAADALDFSQLQLLPLEQCSVVAFGKAVHELADCYPLLKPRVLKAMALAASSDGRLSGTEREVIAAMAAVMDCPLPAAMLDG